MGNTQYSYGRISSLDFEYLVADFPGVAMGLKMPEADLEISSLTEFWEHQMKKLATVPVDGTFTGASYLGHLSSVFKGLT